MLAILIGMLGTPAARAAIALQLFSEPAQSISPVAITEDDEGNLWIAADQGVFQFDGHHFHQVPGACEMPAGIAVMGKHSVLAGCSNGVFQYADGVAKQLTTQATNALIMLGDEMVLALHFRLDAARNPIHWTAAAMLTHDRVEFRSLDGIAGWVWPSVNGWLTFRCDAHPCSVRNTDAFRDAIRSGGLKEYLFKNARVADKIALPPQAESVVADASGTYLYRMPFTGMVSFRPANGKGYDHNVGEFTRANGRAGLYPDRSGRIWIPGDYLYVLEGGKIQKFEAPQLDAVRVNCVFEDRRGRVWFGLFEKGLAAMGMGPVSESWAAPPSMGEIRSIVRQNASTLYAATTKGVLLVRRGSQEWNPVDTGANGPKVVHLAPGDDGTLMGLTSIGPPIRLSPRGKVLAQIRPAPGMMLSSLRPMIRIPDGAYLIGSMQFPPCLFRIRGNRVESLPMQGGDGNVHDVVADAQARVWVGYADGVCRIENEMCKTAIGPADGLLESTVQSLGVGPPDEIWVAYRSAKAFSRFQLKDGRWIPGHFREADGYLMAQTAVIRRDRRGWVWRGTDQGLFVSDGVHVAPADWVHISERDGLPSPNINRFGFLEDTDGSLWIGTARGIAHLSPDPRWFQAERGGITSIRFRDRKFLAATVLPKVLEGSGEFSATAGGSGLLPVRYRLLPVDPQWQVSYTGEIKPRRLEPGRYELEVSAGQGVPSDRYQFQIVRTMAAKLFLALLIAAGVVVIGGPGFFLWRRKVRDARLPPLPDLSEARLAIVSPDLGGLIGSTLVDRFVPQRMIAQGGFGTVFEGNDLETSTRCAVKVFRREFGDEQWITQFQQEIAALEAVRHPNVVQLLGHGVTPAGSTFLAMEFIDGATLREVLSDGPIPAAICSRFLRQIGDALHAIHSRNIFHRDLKPENLMIRKSDRAPADIVLIDFSMAIVKDPDQSLFGLSRAGGTVHYMAPEQALGHASAEGDIYSLGKVAIEMMTGRRITELLPAATLDLSEQMRGFLRAQRFGLSPLSIDLLASALEFDPTRRVKSVDEFIAPIARDLEAFAAAGQ